MSDEPTTITIPCDLEGCAFVARARPGFSAETVLKAHKAKSHATPEEKAARAAKRAAKKAKPAKRVRPRKAAAAPPADPPASSIPGDDNDGEGPAEYVPGFGVLPEEPKPLGWRERLWHRPPKPAKPEKPAGRKRKRESTAELLGYGWGGIGWLVIRLGDAPVGRAMQFQTAAAGPVLEKITADTVIDRAVLQPLARNADAWKDVGTLFMLPVIVAAIERSPDAALTFEPILREVLLANAALIVPVMRKRQAEQAAREEALGDLGIGGVDEMIAALFAPIATTPPPGGAEAEASPGPAASNGAGSFVPGAPAV